MLLLFLHQKWKRKGHERVLLLIFFFDIELTFITATWHVAFEKKENKRLLKNA
jgi:hypothetical protein